ncbi:thiamine pyrophosphate-binding protein [Falsiroseomonas sp.]|uniref:thiamine pyrophosphate-binding protein n=1 Tax=Falsiroseomonas sp. TaxID=2870721 RepID=UPI00271B1EFC|nr:thiamine pyrophosphate-binding protein [Falsiroseomonas sp.]MDO9498856.1 thiamine pyrophosphate-binding protein [Falsiroseomonas sp.]
METMAQRGADVLVSGLKAAGVTRIFTLSGNHIMEVFDALVGSGIELVHTRHEAAAVHMADAYARLTGQVGVALVTGGQGHANATAALCTALAGEVPVLLLSGHAPLADLGNGAFQELPQAALAAPLSKASWAAQTAAGLAEDVARAFGIALGGRPGPVHLSLPTDVLEAKVADAPVPENGAFARSAMPLGAETALLVAQAVAAAARPLLIAPPALCTPSGFAAMAALEASSGLPVVPMQSARGLADPTLGAFAEVLAEADLVVLIGKAMDFTLKFGRSPATAAGCSWIVLEPEGALVARAQRLVEDRLVFAAVADAAASVAALASVMRPVAAQSTWADRVREAVAWRPAEWAALAGAPAGPIRSATLGHAVNAAVAAHGATFVCDGGEIGQWGMSLVRAGTRMVNGVAGAIGVGIPFAIGARAAKPQPTLALMGDGSFGFHMAELDTAARHGLPFVAVVGNDSRWNAEHQIQVRDYGANRAHGCDLAPGTRYDLIATALGGHGETVDQARDLAPALDRAFASGKPAVVNVVLDAQPAPTLRR